MRLQRGDGEFGIGYEQAKAEIRDKIKVGLKIDLNDVDPQAVYIGD